MSANAEQVYKLIKSAPDDLVLQVRDFCEFLLQKREKALDHNSGRELASFLGIMKDSASFKGDPMAVQQRMRDDRT